MSKKYLVTLKPVDKFFFGGDMTFKVEKPSKTKEEDRSSDERFSSYIIKSNTFPQQTSLLGMLRFLLLSDSDYFADGKIINKDGASALIGSKSFEVSDERGQFGCIDELGACFLLNRSSGGDVYYSFLPYASEYQMAEHDSPIQGYVNGKKLTIPKLEGYTAKDGYSERVIGSDKKVLPLSDIFVEDRRIGIARNIENGKTDNSGLFKQISYRFNDFNEENLRIADWHFAFYVTVADEYDLSKYSGWVVSVGGDNSNFVFRAVADVEDIRPDEFLNDKMVVLQSPSYLSADDMQGVKFFISDTIPFRFMRTSVENTVDYTLRAGYQRSCRYELYAPGSVFYFDSSDVASEFGKALEKYKAFRQIGYNEYK